MLNFTVGPVQSDEYICNIGAEQVPYFRTPEFSKIMMENESLIKEFSKAPANSRVTFITGSGTASMEASIMNVLSADDKVLVINGGSFGERFVQLLEIYEIPFTEIKLDIGKTLTAEMLEIYNRQNFTAFVVNMHETSTGVLYNMPLISEFCKRNSLILIVDAISSFLADELHMERLGIDVLIISSQKALACPPGISLIVLSEKALIRIKNNKIKCMYLNLKTALKDGERGQTPFTPAVSILRQINVKLKMIKASGGVEVENKRIAALAQDFREKVKIFPFEFISESMSNAVTAIHPKTASANDIFVILKNEYKIWVCPNGGKLKDAIFRVGHIGNLTINENDILIAAFQDLRNRGLF